MFCSILTEVHRLITSGGVTETYGYDADSERVTCTVGGATTVYLGALVKPSRPIEMHCCGFGCASSS